MSNRDYADGMLAANFANRGAVNEWEHYSNTLKTQLKQSELAFVKAESGRIAFAHLFKTIADELRKVDPNNPLLVKDNQLKIINAKVADQVNTMGFVYDPASGNVIGKRK